MASLSYSERHLVDLVEGSQQRQHLVSRAVLTSKGTGLDKGFWVVSASPVVWVGHHCCGGGGHCGALTEQQLGITAFVKCVM